MERYSDRRSRRKRRNRRNRAGLKRYRDGSQASSDGRDAKGVQVLGLDDVSRWMDLRKRWLKQFLSVYGPMDKCPYHYPRPWIENEEIARAMEGGQVFLGVPRKDGRLLAGMRVKKRGREMSIEGFHPRISGEMCCSATSS